MTFINGVIALGGSITLLISKRNLQKTLLFLVSFSIGGLLGGVIFHLLPEALGGLTPFKTIAITIMGIMAFYLIEKYLHWHHCHKGKCDVHPYTNLILFGDAIHNFIDGLIIASSFLINIPFGILTSMLIILHELPQELGDFGVLVYGGMSKKKALIYNFISQLTAVLGGIVGYYFLEAHNYTIYLLPFAAGGFLYIAINDLTPEVFKKGKAIKKLPHIIAIILGLVIMLSAKILVG